MGGTKKKVSATAKNSESSENVICVTCGKRYSRRKGNFRPSKSPRYAGNEGYLPVCMTCLEKEFRRYYDLYNDEYRALERVAEAWDIFYSVDIHKMARSGKSIDYLISSYFSRLNLGHRGKEKIPAEKTYDDTISERLFGLNFEEQIDDISSDIKEPWDAEELDAMESVIQIVGYDPFKGYTDADRRFLFSDFIGYAGNNEDLKEDGHVVAQILQIVNNNNQIRKYDLIINRYSADAESVVANADTIRKLTQIKTDISSATDKIAKENEISVKNRSNKDSGKSTLGHLQKKLRELNFREAEANYYSQLVSPGSVWAIDVSHKSIVQNAMFDENDKKEIFESQRKLILDLRKQLDDEVETTRILRLQADQLNKNKKVGVKRK